MHRAPGARGVVKRAFFAVLRFPVMRPVPCCCLALAILGVCAGSALGAGTPAPAPPPADSSLLVVYDQDSPIAHERSMFVNLGDSLIVSATASRDLLDEQGGRHPFRKTMVLVVDGRDLGLIRYVSNQEFDGHLLVRGLLPGDTSMTYYSELDGGGDAERVVQPPGRLFVMDSQLFTLFDVLCRSLANKSFTSRRVQLLALQPDSLSTPLATLTFAGSDTLARGGTKLVAKHYRLQDESATFEMWADRRGRLVKLLHPESGLRVERVEAKPAGSTKPATVKKPASASAH
jgi:hypothetical protein